MLQLPLDSLAQFWVPHLRKDIAGLETCRSIEQKGGCRGTQGGWLGGARCTPRWQQRRVQSWRKLQLDL